MIELQNSKKSFSYKYYILDLFVRFKHNFKCEEIEWPLKQYKVYFKNKIMGIMVTLCFGVNCHLILHHNLIHRLNHHHHNLYDIL